MNGQTHKSIYKYLVYSIISSLSCNYKMRKLSYYDAKFNHTIKKARFTNPKSKIKILNFKSC